MFIHRCVYLKPVPALRNSAPPYRKINARPPPWKALEYALPEKFRRYDSNWRKLVAFKSHIWRVLWHALRENVVKYDLNRCNLVVFEIHIWLSMACSSRNFGKFDSKCSYLGSFGAYSPKKLRKIGFKLVQLGGPYIQYLLVLGYACRWFSYMGVIWWPLKSIFIKFLGSYVF